MSPANLTVFVGLFNAAEYWVEIVDYLESQTFKKCHLLIADNASSDGTWDLMQTWTPEGFQSVTKVRNIANVGGSGNLYANLDLVQTTWVTACHQDDVYYSNHLELHEGLTNAASKRVAIVTSSMDRLNNDSYTPTPVPRVNWIASLDSPADVFLTHLRFHTLPFPAASFRTRALMEVSIPWHDTSFPDTEMIMKLAAEWEFVTSPFCTMAYRENPASESHVITSRQREAGQARALLRVFNSPEVIKIAKSVDQDSWDDFFEHASDSIRLRISNESMRNLVLLSLAETLAIAWGYGSRASNALIQAQMEELSNNFGREFFNFKIVKSHDSELANPEIDRSRARFDANSPRRIRVVLKRALIRVTFKTLHRFGMLSWREDLNFKWQRGK
jgi:glycosyltransferase involved in cell wall biosynthesis|tara:strand:- start:339 stop:1502 length:1164 start_codon:yes stop_codon:yes gene_type:complete